MLILWLFNLESVLTDVVQSFVLVMREGIVGATYVSRPSGKTYIEAARDVGIFNQIMSRQQGVVWFNDGVRDLGTGEDGEITEHPWILGDQNVLMAQTSPLQTHDPGTPLGSCSTAALPNHYQFHRPSYARPGNPEGYRLARLGLERCRGWDQSVLHLRCSIPWPSCFPHHLEPVDDQKVNMLGNVTETP